MISMEKSSSVVVIQLEFQGNIAIYVLPPGTVVRRSVQIDF